MKNNILILGGLCMDKYHYIESFPINGEDTLIRNEKIVPGGCALNVSMTLKGLGVNPVIYSFCGDDIYSTHIETYLQEAGLDMQCIKKAQGSSLGYCYVFIDELGERTFMTSMGCEGHFDPQVISPKLLSETEYFYLTGIYPAYKENNNSLCSFLKKSVEEGKKLIFDPGPLIESISQVVLEDLLSTTFIMTPSRNELSTILRKLDFSIIELFAAYSSLEYIVETNGEHGSTLYKRKGAPTYFPAINTEVRDTTGAGDSFTAGIIYGLASGLTIENSIKTATICGALTANVEGPHRIITPEMIKKFL